MEASIKHNTWNQFNVVDKNGFLVYTGAFDKAKNFKRLAEADIYSVSEQDEVEFGDLFPLLTNIEWTGKLKIVPNTEMLHLYIGDFQSWLNWCNKNNRLLKTIKQ